MMGNNLYCNRCGMIIVPAAGYYLDVGRRCLCMPCLSTVQGEFIDVRCIVAPLYTNDYYMDIKVPVHDQTGETFLELMNKEFTRLSQEKKEEAMLNQSVRPESRPVSPLEIYEYLGQYVVGQDEAKKILSVVASNHQTICEYNADLPDILLNKSNILIMGPSGTGKTLMIETLAKFLNAPYVCVSATEFSETGYVGKDVTEILSLLLQNANNETSEAERGIVFIDEVDKILTTSGNNRDVSGAGVQHALLRIIEGGQIAVPVGRHGSSNVMINTSNILFVFGGAFTNLRESKGTKKMTAGFGTSIDESDSLITTTDLMQAGLIREFVGRVHHVVSTIDFTDKDLMRILLEPVDSIIKQHEVLLHQKGIGNVNLRKKKFLGEIVEASKKWGTGARGLKVALEKKLVDIYYNA